jgi:hypothetical protein
MASKILLEEMGGLQGLLSGLQSDAQVSTAKILEALWQRSGGVWVVKQLKGVSNVNRLRA